MRNEAEFLSLIDACSLLSRELPGKDTMELIVVGSLP